MKAGTPIPTAVRMALGRRAKGRCERCGRAAKTRDAHHRLQRSLGGTNALSNLVSVCRVCHDKIHRQRYEAREYEKGWLLRSYWDVEATALLTWAGWMRLNDYGEKFPVLAPDGRESALG